MSAGHWRDWRQFATETTSVGPFVWVKRHDGLRGVGECNESPDSGWRKSLYEKAKRRLEKSRLSVRGRVRPHTVILPRGLKGITVFPEDFVENAGEIKLERL